MPSNSAASMFGGAGGRGARASVSSLEGLRNVLRNETERDAAPAAAPVAPAAAPPAAAPADGKQTLRGLNERLSGYLGRVKQLEQENAQLQREIDEILDKRKVPEGRDWDQLAKPLSDLKDKIKDLTMDNAKLLLQIDNAKLANNDLANKLKDEVKGRKAVESDVVELKKNIADTKQSNMQTQREIDLVKEELSRLEEEHKDEVEQLHEKVKNSEVIVEVDSRDSNLADAVTKIRRQYEKLAEQHQRETEEWYHCKFENIKMEEAQNTEALESGKTQLQDLIRQKQQLEIKLQGRHSTIRNLEENLRSTKVDYNQRMAPLNQRILDLEEQLKRVRAHLESQIQKNKDLLCVKMKLEAEINNYQELMMPHADRPETA
ncbi:keratin, type I cytoskeletal 18-like [Synchiropus splendidus]|uniref:keratin, type I cytoskeletal 18-like n=1 Tax=Synchiropus splendidus TaxID=270530 RepID=UPI00237D40AD|nr:keratin, type I cytoskeletal 18-like [Synchiropus splendidus]